MRFLEDTIFCSILLVAIIRRSISESMDYVQNKSYRQYLRFRIKVLKHNLYKVNDD